MFKSLSGLAFCLSLFSLFHKAECDCFEACERGWDHYMGKCYYVHQGRMYTYEEARTVCSGLGSSLAKVENVQVDLFLKGYKSRYDGNLWLGATDAKHEGKWTWEDGTQVTYTNWAPGQPDNTGGREHCLHLCKDWDLKWNDRVCTTHMGFICEKEATCEGEAVGVESGGIPNSQMTASSEYNDKHRAYQGRLNFVGSGVSSAWCVGFNRVGEWLQIDLGRSRKVTKVATQGRGDSAYPMWVKSYKLGYSEDGHDWKFVADSLGNDKLFAGNHDINTVVYHDFRENSFTARYVRFYPMSWKRRMAMRVEVYAC
ncbi:lactadherin-like isoform X2 [Ptychodera flava]|uniref:lactadherin-like isoform X2 n=1 Tax=Ptychodera flava TaxID=63121 RepID=UPI00396A09F2